MIMYADRAELAMLQRGMRHTITLYDEQMEVCGIDLARVELTEKKGRSLV